MQGVPSMFKKLWSENYKSKASKDSLESKGPWLISLDHASATPFLKYCPNREKKAIILCSNAKSFIGKIPTEKILKEY